MTRLAALVLFLLLASPFFPSRICGQDAHFAAMRSDRGTESRLCDLVHVGVELTLDERARTFEGRVTNRFVSLRPELDVIWLDVADLGIDAVEVGEEDAAFRVEGERLWVDLPRPVALDDELAVTVHYHGDSPSRGLYFIQPGEDDPDVGYEIWSQGQSEDNRRWIPTWDYPTDRATFSGDFTVREGLTVVSNGALRGREAEEPGWTTWHFALDFPFPTYLISICVGDYERYADDFRGIPVEYYVQRGVGEETARRSFGKTPDMLAFFSDRIGIPYPYPKYSQVAVQNFVVGGMENISATTQTDSTLHDARQHLDRSSDSLVAHELAHQWWGDYLTCRTWRHLWLNEGFATYFEALYTEHDQGRDAFLLEMRGNQRAAVGRDRPGRTVPLVESFFSRQERGGGGNHVYVKGSSVLHMIRTQLGDELWWKAIHHYGTKHAGELVDTDDFEVAIEEATGFNLHWIFEQYVYLPGHPDFEVEKRWDPEAKEVVLHVRQTQDTSQMVPVFHLPVPIELTFADGTKTTKVVWITEADQQVRLPAPTAPRMVRFDKGSALLKTVEFEKSAEELAFQALHDDDVVGRMTAVERIGDAGDPALARTTLLAVLESSDHVALRAEAASRLDLATHGETIVPALLRGLGDEEPRVRQSCAAVLGRGAGALGDGRGEAVSALARMAREDLSYTSQVAALDALAGLGGDAALAALREASGFDSPEDEVATAALRGRVRLGDAGALYEILAFAQHSDDADATARGLRLLGETRDLLEGERRAKVVELLLAAAGEGPDATRRAAIASLGRLRAEEARELLGTIAEGDEGVGRRRWWSLPGVARRALAMIDPPAVESAPVEAAAPGVPTTQRLDAINATLRELETEVEALRAEVRARGEREGDEEESD